MLSTRHLKLALRGLGVLAAAAIFGVLALPRPAQAQLANPTIVGSLTNFDVENETENEVEGFEIQIEGIEHRHITRVFGESLAGVCLTRFCSPTIIDIPGGVVIRWAGDWDPVTQQRTTRFNVPGMVVGPRTPVATTRVVSGEDCWSLGLGAAYPTSGCEHFGVSLLANPTKTTYRWLVADPFNPEVLVPHTAGPVAIPAPTAVVVPVDPAKPQLGNMIQQEIQGERSHIGKQYGEAEWVKVYKMDVGRKVDLDELLGGNPVVPMDAGHAETEWKLLQHNRNSKGNSGVLQSKSGSGSSSHAVVRRYEFFHYTGPYDPASHEAMCADVNCDAPSVGELGSYIGAQMAAANLQAPARITLDRTVVGAGGAVIATVVDGPAVAGDWLGLYDAGGALVTSYRDWKYLNGSHGKPDGGVANAAVPFNLPAAEGQYNLKLFAAGTYDVVATSAPITVATPRLSLSDTTVAAGGSVTATITNAPGMPGDWVGLFDASDAGTSYREWKYLNGSHDKPAAGSSSALVTFTLPSTPGKYNLRLFADSSFTTVATSDLVTVTAAGVGTPSTIEVSRAGGTVTGTIANGPGTPGDWIGLFDIASGATSYLQWQYLNGSSSKPAAGLKNATVTFTLPLTPGTYELRLFANSSYTLAATSAPIKVAAASLTLESGAVVAGGTVRVRIANGLGRPGDWVALYGANGSSIEYLQWQYLNGSQEKPAVGVTDATLTFTVPSTPGTYNLRLFMSSTYQLLATSEALAVP